MKKVSKKNIKLHCGKWCQKNIKMPWFFPSFFYVYYIKKIYIENVYYIYVYGIPAFKHIYIYVQYKLGWDFSMFQLLKFLLKSFGLFIK